MTDTRKQENTFAMLCHLTALSMFIGIPFGNILGPLIIWLIKKNEFPMVDESGKESLNFQISMTIYALISALLTVVLIGYVIILGLLIANLVLIIIASVKTSNGEKYTYPLTIRFLK